MTHHQTIHAAQENGAASSTMRGARVSVDEVIELLVAGCQQGRHAAVRLNANRLLALMARGPWQIMAGSHVGGLGGGGRAPDRTRHMTLHVRRNGYHLRHDARGHLFEITGPGMLPIPPWASPGSPIESS